MIFIFHSINVVYHTERFAYVEASLYSGSRDEGLHLPERLELPAQEKVTMDRTGRDSPSPRSSWVTLIRETVRCFLKPRAVLGTGHTSVTDKQGSPGPS